jgi:hypothetical protein
MGFPCKVTLANSDCFTNSVKIAVFACIYLRGQKERDERLMLDSNGIVISNGYSGNSSIEFSSNRIGLTL